MTFFVRCSGCNGRLVEQEEFGTYDEARAALAESPDVVFDGENAYHSACAPEHAVSARAGSRRG